MKYMDKDKDKIKKKVTMFLIKNFFFSYKNFLFFSSHFLIRMLMSLEINSFNRKIYKKLYGNILLLFFSFFYD